MEISARSTIWSEATCAGFSSSGRSPTSVRPAQTLAGDPAGADLLEERRGLRDEVILVRRRGGAEGPRESLKSHDSGLLVGVSSKSPQMMTLFSPLPQRAVDFA
jgi:hypothetical protein